MSGGVLIGIGNAFRRDDGVGLAVAEEIGKIGVPGVQVVTAIGEPAIWDAILDRLSRAARRWNG